MASKYRPVHRTGIGQGVIGWSIDKRDVAYRWRVFVILVA
jgi:hypothetical protein